MDGKHFSIDAINAMLPDINAAVLFVRVVEQKSFSAAAKQLRMPVSTLSRKISALEKALGTRLLERSTRSLRLTELGQEYYAYCRRAVETLESGTRHLNDRQSEVTGTLHISAPPNLSEALLAPLICGFQSAYPRTVVKVLITERNVDMIAEGIDIALRVGPLQASRLVARPLLHYRHILVAAPGYLAARNPIKHPQALLQQRVIAFGGWQGPLSWQLNNHSKSITLQLEPALSFNDFAAVQYAVQTGQGIAEIPAMICGEALRQGRLIEVLPHWRFAPTVLSAVYPSTRNLARMVRLFKDYCLQQLEHTAPFTGL